MHMPILPHLSFLLVMLNLRSSKLVMHVVGNPKLGQVAVRSPGSISRYSEFLSHYVSILPVSWRATCKIRGTKNKYKQKGPKV